MAYIIDSNVNMWTFNVLNIPLYLIECASVVLDMSIQTHAHVSLLRQPSYFIILLCGCVCVPTYRYTWSMGLSHSNCK
jgi:hypothetical protein